MDILNYFFTIVQELEGQILKQMVLGKLNIQRKSAVTLYHTYKLR